MPRKGQNHSPCQAARGNDALPGERKADFCAFRFAFWLWQTRFKARRWEEHVTKVEVETKEQLIEVIDNALKLRSKLETTKNTTSTRGHTFVKLLVGDKGQVC